MTPSLTLLYISPYHIWLSNIQEKYTYLAKSGEFGDCFSSRVEHKLSVSRHFLQLYLLQYPYNFEKCLAHNKQSMFYSLNEWMNDLFEPRLTISAHRGTFNIVHFPNDIWTSRKLHNFVIVRLSQQEKNSSDNINVNPRVAWATFKEIFILSRAMIIR